MSEPYPRPTMAGPSARASARDPWLWTLVAVLVAAIPLLVHQGREQSFHLDEFDFIVNGSRPVTFPYAKSDDNFRDSDRWPILESQGKVPSPLFRKSELMVSPINTSR